MTTDLPNLEDLGQLAATAVAAACGVCQRVRADLGEDGTVAKGDKSPVTVADFASQAVVAATISQSGLPMVAEEDADEFAGTEDALRQQVLAAVQTVRPEADAEEVARLIGTGNGEPTGTYWVLDPIDGTKGFLRGGQYAVALGLIHDGRPVLGVLGCPGWDIGRLFGSDRPTTSAWTTDLWHVDQRTPITVAGERRPKIVESVESGHSDHGTSAQIIAALDAEPEPQRMDSQAKYAAVACGVADVYLRLPTRPGYEERVWDHAAGVAVIETAGGRVTDLDGNPLDFTAGRTLKNNRGVVATSDAGDLHDRVLKAARGV
jgi:3'(2'), 5'-bisphosphate nucleotidase